MKRNKQKSIRRCFRTVISMLLAVMLFAVPVCAAEPGQADNDPAEVALLGEGSVMIKTYNYQTHDWDMIYLVDGNSYSTYTSNYQISQTGFTTPKIGIVSIEWQKYDSETGDYKTDTSGKFTAGKWKCLLKLNGVSPDNIHDGPSGYGSIYFDGFPEGTTWMGDGNSSGNVTYHTVFTVQEPQTIGHIDVDGVYPYAEAGKPVTAPSCTLPTELSWKGVRIDEVYWLKKPAQYTEEAIPWYACSRVSDGSVFEPGQYYIVVRFSCTDPRYRLSDELSVTLNGISFYCQAQKQSDGSVISANGVFVYVEKDGVECSFIDGSGDKMRISKSYSSGLTATDLTIPGQITVGGKTYTVQAIGDFAFHNMDIEKVTIPATVELIDDYAFAECMNLSVVTIEEGSRLNLIKEDAFGSGTGHHPLVFRYCETDTQAKQAVQDYLHWAAEEAGWDFLTAESYQPSEKIVEVSPEIVFSERTFTYNGKMITPAVKVKEGSKVFAPADYTVTYKNNKDVGKASVTVEMKGKYKGTKTAFFRIVPKGTKISKLLKAPGAITVKWKKQTARMSAKRIAGYEIQVATNKNFTKNVKSVKVKGFKKVSKKIAGLKGGKKYYVHIRTYRMIDGNPYFSAWSKTKAVKTKK